MCVAFSMKRTVQHLIKNSENIILTQNLLGPLLGDQTVFPPSSQPKIKTIFAKTKPSKYTQNHDWFNVTQSFFYNFTI
jgi:hypothetical protein